MNIGIVGAGFTGLAAAYDLTKQGHAVTVYEARSYAGGLASGFRDETWEWHLDRFYHHWFATDEEVIRLIDDVGARDRLFFPRPTTSIYHRGHIYPFDSPLRVLRFTPLPLIDRLRVGLVTLHLKMTHNWQVLEQVTAEEWIRRAAGRRAYEVLWKPLLISKFGERNYRQVNMAWLWARLHKRTPRLGYFEGGFQAFADLLMERVQAQGGTVRLETRAQAVRPAPQDKLRLETATDAFEHDHVVATCSPQIMKGLAPDLPANYEARLDRLQSMGAVALILALRRPLVAQHYWINLPAGEGFPFMGLVEHTNTISPEHYGGDHIVYCGDYLPPDHPYFSTSVEQLLEAYLPGLTKINPDFRREWIRDRWMFAEKYAQPIPVLKHSRNILPLQTPIPGLWMANMSQVYPWDRGTNYAVEMGRRVAAMIGRST